MKHIYIAAAAMLAMVGMQPASAQLRSESVAEQVCEASSCFGIDWRLAPLSQVRKLPSGLVSPGGITPLHLAVRHCASPVVLYALAENGAAMNRIDPGTALVPLANAMLVCREATIRTLLDLGASPLAFEPLGGNMLHFALRNERGSFVPLLLDYTVDLEQRDDNGLTPLQLALWSEDIDASISLLDAGANPNIRGAGNLTLAHLAVYREDINLLRALSRAGADLGLYDDKGRTPLHYAAANGLSKEMASVFFTGDVDINPPDNSGKAPIHYAAALADSNSVATLLALHADPDLPDVRGDRPLIHALRDNSDVGVVSSLIRMGADPNQMAGDGTPPVHIAAIESRNEALEELIAAGADIKLLDRKGRTLLHHAVISRNSELALRLLELGFDPDAADREGNTPLRLARRIQLSGPGGDRFKQIEDQRIAEQKAKEAAAQALIAEQKENEVKSIQRAREAYEQGKSERAAAVAPRPVNLRALNTEIVRRENALSRLLRRQKNLHEGSPAEIKLAETIAAAEQKIASLRAQHQTEVARLANPEGEVQEQENTDQTAQTAQTGQ